MKTWPAGAGVKFIAGMKKRGRAAHAQVVSLFFLVPEIIVEGAFRAVFAGYAVLLGSEPFFPEGFWFVSPVHGG